jgi:hypothetical protein
MGNLLLVMVLGIAMAVMYVVTALNIGKNSLTLVCLIAVSPLPIASIINEKSESFLTFIKSVVSLYFSNFFSIAVLQLSMIFSTSGLIAKQGVWVQVIIVLAGILLAMAGVPVLSRFFGGDTGQSNTLQQLAYTKMLAGGALRTLGGGAIMAANTGSFSAAGAAYGVGRMLGGESMTAISTQQNAKSQQNLVNMFKGGAAGSEGVAKGYPTTANNDIRFTKDDSYANRFANLASTLHGPDAITAYSTSLMARHVYAASMNRLQRKAFAPSQPRRENEFVA